MPSHPPSRAGEVLAAVHRSPGISRAELADALGLSSGLASDLVARLVGAAQLCEGEPRGGRGRPTRTLRPHPEGPLVAVAAISHERWRVELRELGGESVLAREAGHDRDASRTLGAVRRALRAAYAAHPARLRAIAVSAPGTVSGTRLVQAPNLGWRDLDLEVLRPAEAGAIPLLAGNDANFTAVAEHARGAARGRASALVLFMDSGIGGALIDRGEVTLGASGMTGEFGHMPLGGSRRRCRCGARGCWNVELEGAALARRLSRPTPADEVSFSRSVIAAARAGAGPERRAATSVGRLLARGIAGIVNACDPELVVLCGLAAELLALAGDGLTRVYREGLMAARRETPPSLVPGELGDRAPLIGAMESAFAGVLALLPS